MPRRRERPICLLEPPIEFPSLSCQQMRVIKNQFASRCQLLCRAFSFKLAKDRAVFCEQTQVAIVQSF